MYMNSSIYTIYTMYRVYIQYSIFFWLFLAYIYIYKKNTLLSSSIPPSLRSLLQESAFARLSVKVLAESRCAKYRKPAVVQKQTKSVKIVRERNKNFSIKTSVLVTHFINTSRRFLYAFSPRTFFNNIFVLDFNNKVELRLSLFVK